MLYIVIKLYLKNQILVFAPVPPLDRLAIGPGSEDGPGCDKGWWASAEINLI